MAAFEVPEVDYTRYSNRQLVAVPLAVLALALLVIAAWYLTTGTPVRLGMEFTGGTELVVQTGATQSQVADAFDPAPTAIRPVQNSNSYIVSFQATGQDDALRRQATEAGYTIRSLQQTTPAFASQAQQTALLGVVVAFVGMSVVVFALFRSFVPSIAVVASAFSDLVIPVALMNLLNIKLSLGTVAALLMLIGYSVDSDILLNNHVLRRSGDFYESTHRAMQTGVTMTVTSISAMVVMTIVAFAFGIQLLTSIGVVLVMGLTADLMNTYMLNLSLLRWWKFEGVARFR
ncbi:MAG: protein translocase subunit SecF [Halobacteriaceae archaeon]